MGYRIEYDSFQKEKTEAGVSRKRMVLMTVFFGALFLAGVYRHSPEGRELLQTLLSPRRWELTRRALEELAGALGSGMPAMEAVTVFCREILMAGMEYAA